MELRHPLVVVGLNLRRPSVELLRVLGAGGGGLRPQRRELRLGLALRRLALRPGARLRLLEIGFGGVDPGLERGPRLLARLLVLGLKGVNLGLDRLGVTGDLGVDDIAPRAAEDGPANGLHPRIERHDPLLLDLGHHRRLAGRQALGRLVQEIRPDPDAPEVDHGAAEPPAAAPTATPIGPPSSPIRPPVTRPTAVPSGPSSAGSRTVTCPPASLVITASPYRVMLPSACSSSRIREPSYA